jgi:hypothetical protein
MNADLLAAANLVDAITRFVAAASVAKLEPIALAHDHLRRLLNSCARVAAPMGRDADLHAREVIHEACTFLRARQIRLEEEREERWRRERDALLEDGYVVVKG